MEYTSRQLPYRIEDAPEYFARCLVKECPVAKECLRQLVQETVGDRDPKEWIISPAHTRPDQGKECPYFFDPRPERKAYGFKKVLSSLTYENALRAKTSLMSALGSRSVYYRRLNGELPLTPEEEDRVTRILAYYGAKEPVKFDEYREVSPWK